MSNNLIGVQVYCKRDGSQGKIVAVSEADGTVSIEVDGKIKVVTNSVYKRWYTLVPTENPESVVEPTAASNTAESTEDKPSRRQRNTTDEKAASGEAGIGLQLRNKFIALVKDFQLPKLDLFHNEEKKTDVIKLNGKNVFECSYASKRFNVLCHPDSLSPDNKKRVTKMCPETWGWSLSARFTFTTLDEVPLMKSIISDGLYFRKDKKEGAANDSEN